MAVPYYRSFRIDHPNLLPPPRNQLGSSLCWCVASVTQFEAALKLAGMLPFGERLSPQDLLNNMQYADLYEDGGIMNLESITEVLVNTGIVTEAVCPFTMSLYEEPGEYGPTVARFRLRDLVVHNLGDYMEDYGDDFGRRLFESEMMTRLAETPIAGRVSMGPNYEILRGQEIHDLTEREKRFATRHEMGHWMVMSGHGKVASGMKFKEFQDSYGLNVGDGGYVRVAAANDVITHFVEMSV